MTSPPRCEYARAAVASARAGIEMIREQEPHGYRALFMALGLVAITRHVWHAVLREKEKYRESIERWEKSPPGWTKRLKPILNSARDNLLKEWRCFPQVSTGAGGYQLAIYVDAGPEQKAVMTPEELRDHECNTQFLAARGESDPGFRIDLLKECEQILNCWDKEISSIEQQIAWPP